LNTDCHSSKLIVRIGRRVDNRTPKSCGIAPSPKNKSWQQQFYHPISSNAGFAPAFSIAAGIGGASEFRICADVPAAACVTEFISVSGQCAARSALHSDLRLKRFSGVDAATEHLRAPMNSPNGSSGSRGFHSQPL